MDLPVKERAIVVDSILMSLNTPESEVIVSGEFNISGFQNKNLRNKIAGKTAGQISRTLKTGDLTEKPLKDGAGNIYCPLVPIAWPDPTAIPCPFNPLIMV